MISEGSCDPVDWSNAAENSALIKGINNILKYIKIENAHFKLYSFLLYFDQLHAVLVSIRDFFKNIKILPPQTSERLSLIHEVCI